MQWLIDLVIEAIGIPPTLIDRGDPAAADFTVANLTIDGAWHDLDLSGIVPSNASAVLFNIFWLNTFVAMPATFRKKGNVNTANVSEITTLVAGMDHPADKVCPIGSDGLLEYRISAGFVPVISITVKGWWL